MKMLSVLLIITCMQAYGSIGANAQQVTFAGKNIPMKTVFEKIRMQTGVEFVWDKNIIGEANPVTVEFKNTPLKEALDLCFKGQRLRYSFIDNVIVVTRSAEPPAAAADKAPVSGRVFSEEKKPLEGVNVVIKGTTQGTSTDADGNFVISAEPGQVLVFSSVGYIPQEIKVGTAVNYAIYLKVYVANLDQTIVVGYGTQSKRNVTGSIAKVGELKPEENINNSVFSAMQGKVAGLQVKSSDGSPGSQPSIVIRGAQTLNASNVNPLVVIDGLIVDAGVGLGTVNNPNFNFNNINPQDIESIEVLKDASSSAIYGARGAQGVIMITTKKGKLGGRPLVNVNSYYGITRSTLGFRALNNAEYESVFKEARRNRISDIDKLIAGGVTPEREEVLNEEKDVLDYEISSFKLGTPNGLVDNNWVDKVISKNASTHNIQANVSGGGVNNTYYLSFGKYSEENTVGSGRYNRYSGKMALTQKINKWLRIGGDLNVSLSESNNLTTPLYDAIAARPDTPDSLLFNPDGTVGNWFALQSHPYAGTYQTYQKKKDWNYLANVFGEITFRPNLVFKSTLAGVNSQGTTINFYSPLSYYGSYNGGQHGNSSGSGTQYTFNNTLTYRLAAGDLCGDLLLGQEYYENKNTTTGFAITGFPGSEGLWSPGNGSSFSNNELWNNRNYSEAGESYFFRSNLSWQNRYLLSGSIRRDGTSKLAGNNRYSWFPALSAGWIISDEPFFGRSSLVSFLKIKSGAGLTGNIRTLGYFDFADLINTSTYNGKPALALSNVRGNRDLRWERTRQYDAGIEARFFRNKVSMTLEFYEKRTDGLITSLPLPYSTGGFASQKGNLGTVANRGIDLDLSYRSRLTNDQKFSWNAGVILNVNRNKILYLRDSVMGYGYYMPGGPRPFVKMGQSVGSLLLFRSLGVDPNTGDLVYEDKNKDGVISQADQEYVPVAQPKISGGFNLGASWHRITVSAALTFSAGAKIYNLDDQYSRLFNIDYTGVMPNKPEWVKDRWKQPGDKSYYPRAVVGPHGAGQVEDWNTLPSTHYLFDASYLRMRNVTIGYQVDEKVLRKVGIPALRIYTSFQNLFVIKNRDLKLTDPEIGIETGIQSTFIPMPRTFAFGIDVTL
ncbi:TonB-dependent receptor [Chitinophaga arvensicola]|nr:TonB-dependent receptor [Chitinophaga arvensicola]